MPPSGERFFRTFSASHNGFLFSKLQNCSETSIFILFAMLPSRETAAGCYIDFSGFSTSRVHLAQDKFF
jgi:hypothetical protein